MSFASRSLVAFSVGLICVAGLVVACGDDDSTSSSSSSGGKSSSGDGTSSGGTSGKGTSSGGTSGTSSGGTSGGTSSGGTSGGTSGTVDAGNDANTGGKKKDGEVCSAADTGDSECESGNCRQQGSAANATCTELCTSANAADKCKDTTIFTGTCTGQGFCKAK